MLGYLLALALIWLSVRMVLSVPPVRVMASRCVHVGVTSFFFVFLCATYANIEMIFAAKIIPHSDSLDPTPCITHCLISTNLPYICRDAHFVECVPTFDLVRGANFVHVLEATQKKQCTHRKIIYNHKFKHATMVHNYSTRSRHFTSTCVC